ncbi:MAG: DNA polymerase/3'-5' exonuclease PolX [Candidatus Margulisiibacteriota bacterium]
MQNKEIANIFWNVAELLELKSDNPFKIRAYQKAARNIESLNHTLKEIYAQGGLPALEEVPGIGKSMADHIEEILKTGKLKKLTELQKAFPKNFVELVNIPGMGPKTTLLLHDKLGINSPEKLEKAIKSGKLKGLPGMGEKKEANILRGIELKKKSHGRFLLDEATAHAALIVEELGQLKEADKILPCGSLRRGKETIGDIDILVVSNQPDIVMDKFCGLSMVKEILAKGKTKSSVILRNAMEADLRVVEAQSFGAASHYFTGSKEHNIHLRQLAKQKGWKVSEYGIFHGEKQIGGETEKEMFAKFGLQYIPPELREMRGEFEAATKGQIPELIELKEIKGDLHMHTTASDGRNSIEEMAMAAKAKGYEYILITDHTVSTRIAHGLKEADMSKHLRKIREASAKVKGIKILAGAEVDIKPDGSLDYSDDLLKQLDIVLISIHSSFKMPEDKMTNRIIKAMQNPYANIFTHPTGRLIGEREAYALDMEKILLTAKENNVGMEINAHPKRLDLNDVYCKRAKELGVKIVINTDAHSVSQLDLMQYGVITARRGWLEAKDVLNTYSLEKLLKAI